MQVLYLTRRNLLTLLSKLDRNKEAAGEPVSHCTIIKRDTVHPKYPSTDVIQVTAVEDEDYYTDRPQGRMVPEDEERIKRLKNLRGPRPEPLSRFDR